MAKFIKFNIVASDQALTATGVRLVNVDQIESVVDVLAGAVVSAVITLKEVSGVAAVATGDSQAAYSVPAQVAVANGPSQAAYDVPAVVAGASTIGTLNGRTITLGVSIASNAATNPVAITVQRNMPSQAVFAALSANPGGVIASAQLGLDGNGIAPGVGGGTATQMYWRTFTIASAIVA